MLTKEEIIAVNREMRQNDESHLWPICGKFSVAERSIRQARNYLREGVGCDSAEEYRALLDDLESAIVNDESNW